MFICLHFAIFLLCESEEFEKGNALPVNNRFLRDNCNALIIMMIQENKI